MSDASRAPQDTKRKHALLIDTAPLGDCDWEPVLAERRLLDVDGEPRSWVGTPGKDCAPGLPVDKTALVALVTAVGGVP
jgi:hypothetical protein